MVEVNNLSASPGDYEVSIKFNNEHIPDSPFIVPIATLSDEARRLTVTSLQVSSRTLPHTHTQLSIVTLIICLSSYHRQNRYAITEYQGRIADGM